MMHVMQPVVLDTGWSTTHSSAVTTACPSTASCYVTAVSAGPLSSGLVRGANWMASTVQDGHPPHINAATSFNTRSHFDNPSLTQPTSANTHASTTASQATAESPPKPPKKPLTPYMRFSKHVCWLSICCAFLWLIYWEYFHCHDNKLHVVVSCCSCQSARQWRHWQMFLVSCARRHCLTPRRRTFLLHCEALKLSLICCLSRRMEQRLNIRGFCSLHMVPR